MPSKRLMGLSGEEVSSRLAGERRCQNLLDLSFVSFRAKSSIKPHPNQKVADFYSLCLALCYSFADKPKAAVTSAPQSKPRRSQSPTRNARRQRQAQFYAPPRQQLFTLVENRSKADENAAAEEKFVRTVADKIRQYGQRFEDLIREKEKDNEKFKFLKESDSLMSQFFLALTNESYVPEVPSADFEDEVSIYSTFEPNTSLTSLLFVWLHAYTCVSYLLAF